MNCIIYILLVIYILITYYLCHLWILLFLSYYQQINYSQNYIYLFILFTYIFALNFSDLNFHQCIASTDCEVYFELMIIKFCYLLISILLNIYSFLFLLFSEMNFDVNRVAKFIKKEKGAEVEEVVQANESPHVPFNEINNLLNTGKYIFF